MMGTKSFSHTPLGDWVEVGNYSSIARDVKFLEAGLQHWCKANKRCVYSTNFRLIEDKDNHTIIGHDVWIGDEAFIMHGVKIGNGAIIGSRAMVTKDVPPFAVVVGNPGRIIRYRFTDEQIEALNKIQWWLWPEKQVVDNLKDFEDIDEFINKYR